MSSDLILDDPTSLSGMSLLINTNNLPPGYNPTEIEQRIVSTNHPRTVDKSISFTQELENQLDSLTANYSNHSALMEPNVDLNIGGNSDIDQLLNSMTSSTSYSFPSTTSYSHPIPSQSSGMKNFYQDPTLNFMTNEQKKQNVIGEVFDDINNERGGNSMFSMEKEKEEDDKQHKLEHISFLIENLVGEGEDLSNIPKVNGNNTLSEIDQVLKRLLLRNDRKRCGSFAEEVILLGAHGIEWLCDGQKTYLGFKPDMTDWHKSVQTKLRRMRYDTSNVVAGIMEEYKMGSGTRILLELIPSMFLYSRMRKSQHKDTITDDEFNAGMNKLRDLEVPS